MLLIDFVHKIYFIFITIRFLFFTDIKHLIKVTSISHKILKFLVLVSCNLLNYKYMIVLYLNI